MRYSSVSKSSGRRCCGGSKSSRYLSELRNPRGSGPRMLEEAPLSQLESLKVIKEQQQPSSKNLMQSA